MYTYIHTYTHTHTKSLIACTVLYATRSPSGSRTPDDLGRRPAAKTCLVPCILCYTIIYYAIVYYNILK